VKRARRMHATSCGCLNLLRTRPDGPELRICGAGKGAREGAGEGYRTPVTSLKAAAEEDLACSSAGQLGTDVSESDRWQPCLTGLTRRNVSAGQAA
jgi:hypothetical protein